MRRQQKLQFTSTTNPRGGIFLDELGDFLGFLQQSKLMVKEQAA
jgi:hypothetical protein